MQHRAPEEGQTEVSDTACPVPKELQSKQDLVTQGWTLAQPHCHYWELLRNAEPQASPKT